MQLHLSSKVTAVSQLISPMNDVHLVLIIPLGRRWKSYSFSSTTTVWPALFPPCGETQKLTRFQMLYKLHAGQFAVNGNLLQNNINNLKDQGPNLQSYFLQKGDLETWLQHPGSLPFTQTLCVQSWTQTSSLRHLYATGFYGQRRALLTCPVTPGMWPEFSEGQWGILGLTFREIQTLTAAAMNC